MASLPQQITDVNVKKFIDSFDTVLSDCDGVLWSGEQMIGEANKSVSLLQSLGKQVFFVTNNSTKSRDDYVVKCQRLGFNMAKDNIVSSSFVLAEYLKQKNFKKKVYIVGSLGMTQELEQVGVPCLYTPEEPSDGKMLSFVNNIKLDPEVGAVAVGMDPFFNFVKIMRAASYLNDPQCLFLATNTDERFPVSNTSLVYPGTGCLVRCVETVAERPPVIMGKPSEMMFSVISEKHKLNPKRTLMIGDRCNTDILFGKNCGLLTLVVMSGVTEQSHLEAWAASEDPQHHQLLADYRLNEISDLIPLLEALQ